MTLSQQSVLEAGSVVEAFLEAITGEMRGNDWEWKCDGGISAFHECFKAIQLLGVLADRLYQSFRISCP